MSFVPAHGGIESTLLLYWLPAQTGSGDFTTLTLLFLSFGRPMPDSSKSRSALSTAFFCAVFRGGVMIASLQVAVRVYSPSCCPTGAVFGQQRRRHLFVGFTQLRTIIFTEFRRWPGGEKIRPRSIVCFRQRLAVFPAIRRAMRHNAFYRRPAIGNAFGDRRHHMLQFNYPEKRRQ